MLTISIDDFMIELKDGSIRNVGAPSKTASVKVFDVVHTEARAFGDNRVKLACEDDEGNAIEIALFPDEVRSLLADIERLERDGAISID